MLVTPTPAGIDVIELAKARRQRVPGGARAGIAPCCDHHCPRMPTMNMRSEKFECAGWSGHTR